ncbi:unnamed protein product [Lactuca virosa]|uniref:Uncharacterized protein n=1 Tax=Lactuca virosa TaxID=75947 RepID=A0AAU9P275_9ASTR|nr:unnamed protein product [Lactuca virosa]CAH1444372.1 unnamed protein product [Lactuca virosa]
MDVAVFEKFCVTGKERDDLIPFLFNQPEKTHTDVLSDARPTCYKKESKMKATLLKKIIVLFNIHVL